MASASHVAEPEPPAPALIVAAVSTSAASTLLVTDTEHWLELVAQSSLRGPAKLLAEHASFVAHSEGVLRLALEPAQEHLKSPSLVLQLCDAIGRLLGGEVKVRLEAGESRGDTAHRRNVRARDVRQSEAEQGFTDHPDIRRLVQEHGAKIVPDSIRPLGDT